MEAYNRKYLLEHPISKEWDYEKNIGVDIKDIGWANQNKYWWKCLKEGHSWCARVNSRIYSKSKGCPCCSGKKSFSHQQFIN